MYKKLGLFLDLDILTNKLVCLVEQWFIESNKFAGIMYSWGVTISNWSKYNEATLQVFNKEQKRPSEVVNK